MGSGSPSVPVDGLGHPLGSLIREDLQSVPGPVLAAAEAVLDQHPGDERAQLDACLAALAAGEPRRALAHLRDSRQRPRVSAALIAWARQLDSNWYPGGVGAELSTLDTDGLFVEARPGEPVEELLEQVVSHGPPGLSTPRVLLELSLRNGQLPGVQQAVAVADSSLDELARYAAGHGMAEVATWAGLAAADIARRAGLPESAGLLATARGRYSQAEASSQLALTYLVEGDWYAAPGSSPESLGWDLAPYPATSPFLPADVERARTCYEEAAALLDDGAPPRLRAALALRLAMLAGAGAGGDPSTRRRHLDEAAAGFRSAGDTAGYHLAVIHRLVADIDEGVLGRHAVDLGGGWHRPRQGPVAEVLAWAESVGSRSWCVGLGRLLQRCADQWAARGSAARSRIGYVGALQLISLDPGVPVRTLMTAIANADSRSNLATNALLRLERAFGPLLAGAVGGGELAFPQQVEAAFVMLSALRDRSRGAAAWPAADRLTSLGSQLAQATDEARARLPTPSGQPPTTVAGLQAALAARQGDGSLEAQAGGVDEAVALMQHTLLDAAQAAVDTAEVLAALTRGEAAQRAGQVADADRWFATAVAAAGRPGVPAHLLPLALLSAQRLDDARAALLDRAAQIDDELQLPLWLRAKDVDSAGQALARMAASGAVPDGWRDRLSVAEVHLGRGEYAAARRVAQQAIAAFEGSARLLVRDPERLDACDQPDVAALFTTLALTHLPPGQDPTAADCNASFEAAEHARALSSDAVLGGVDAAVRQEWQRAAAEYAAVGNQLLARLASATPEQQRAGFAQLDEADGALAEAEHAVEAQDPGVLLRRAGAGAQPTAADLRRRLPAGMVLLEYLAVGDDLLSWALTSDDLLPLHQQVRLRDLMQLVRSFHTGCAAGRAPATELARLLVEPFAAVLRENPRVVVVPFGPLSLVPVHALRLDGIPLAMSHVVSYAQRAAELPEHEPGLDRPAAAARPLVVGDPAFEPSAYPSLPALPGARAEAAAVAAALGVPAGDVLVGPAATEAAVAERLEACDLLHLSCHGRLDELSPFASSLVLAGRDELTVADVAGLRFGTDLAVLTGCNTGRGNATLGGDLVGLTRSLVRSGVDRCVVSLWPVDDWVAPVLIAGFAAGLAQRLAPAPALASAQRAMHAMSADQLQAAAAALGALGADGDAGGEGSGGGGTDVGRRRGRDLDPDPLTETPGPLAGDAERYWAPFVVVG